MFGHLRSKDRNSLHRHHCLRLVLGSDIIRHALANVSVSRRCDRKHQHQGDRHRDGGQRHRRPKWQIRVSQDGDAEEDAKQSYQADILHTHKKKIQQCMRICLSLCKQIESAKAAGGDD